MYPYTEFVKQFRDFLETAAPKSTPSLVSRVLPDTNARIWCDLVHAHLIADKWVNTLSLKYAALVAALNKIPGRASYERRARVIVKIDPWNIDTNAFWEIFLTRLNKDSARQGFVDRRSYTETEHDRFCKNLFEEIHASRISYWELCDIFLTVQGKKFACNQYLVDAVADKLCAIIYAT